MFISYQKVRNTVVGTTTAVVGGVATFWGLQDSNTDQTPAYIAEGKADHSLASERNPTTTSETEADSLATSKQVPLKPATPQRVRTSPQGDRKPRVTATKSVTDIDRYLAAMKIAMSPANGVKGKDVLGAKSPWKLNLYDDNNDGQWDRGKLDYDRDEKDDERWNYKNERWEKDGGALVWSANQWVDAESTTGNVKPPMAATKADTDATRYQQAMKKAASPAIAGKGKDVLGAKSPWKLNLYDDNNDGQWDRGKLDYNRDDVDDEKWNFKDGRWEKDGGALVWSVNRWVSTDENPPTSTNAKRYQAAMEIATSRATTSKGKDVLGAKSPWKLNLYDDDNDGQWDRGKLDYDRDDVDDEKWNFKKGRWEKDGGAKIWNGADWESAR